MTRAASENKKGGKRLEQEEKGATSTLNLQETKIGPCFLVEPCF